MHYAINITCKLMDILYVLISNQKNSSESKITDDNRKRLCMN